jgi:putative protein-disulfide isomerase
MPIALQNTISATWRRIQQDVPATDFNHNFWTLCQPRRSTYPACRAVIAARAQMKSAEEPMILAIQQAYYMQAKNPSDGDVLVTCAKEIGLDAKRFEKDLNSVSIDTQFRAEIKLAREMGVHSFPSVIVERAGKYSACDINYNDVHALLQQLD